MRPHGFVLAGALSGPALCLTLAAAPGASEAPRELAVEEMVAALEGSRGYDITAIANSARLNAEAFLRLARAARERDPQGPPLRIGHARWREAYLRRAGLPPDQAPIFVRLAFENQQDTELDYRADRVLRPGQGPVPPPLAVNVRTGWPEMPDRPDSYSYVDERSSPQLRVTMARILTYRLVDFGDRIYFGEVEGLRGRPVSGLLGALFDLIGEPRILENWMAVAPDGTQVARGRGKKGFIDVTTTVTILPDGRAEKGLPPGRPDLVDLETRLKQTPRLEFVPLAP
jgi:hypothetical protein